MEANDQDLVACDYRREAVGDCLDLHKEEDTGACRQDGKVEGIRCRAAAPDTFLDGAKPMATFHLADHVVPSCLLLLLRCHHQEAEDSIPEADNMANMDTADAAACCQQMAVVDSSALVSQFQVLTAQQPPLLLPTSFF